MSDVSEYYNHSNSYSYPRFDIIIPSVYGIITLAGGMGNGMVLMVLLRNIRSHSIPDVYISNLAIADLLTVLTLPLFSYTYATGSWIFGLEMCKIMYGLDSMYQFTGIMILTVMSIDRYVAIASPVRSKRYRTACKARCISVCVWFASFLCSSPLWFYATLYVEPSGVLTCQIMWPNPQKNAFVFLIFGFVAGFLVPLIAIFFSYLALLMTYSKHRTWRKGITGQRMASMRRGSRRIAILIITIVIGFVVCWLPFYVLNFITIYLPDTDKGSGSLDYTLLVAYVVSVCLCYFNSCLNPVIYSFVGSSFRTRLSKAVHCRLPRQKETCFTRSQQSYRSTHVRIVSTRNSRSTNSSVVLSYR
ncbi:somatostatin receptor type 3-like [Saccoglossus kowalevskii]|uniref:Somatostatin receptor type 3-like n=1 Tax=Saccoglossus kowalevskii TaxID=10224 RepID=A0ABM0MCE9_SACKO|nr:PREDICTED: somatostatin receptor type 3-like [Saccoglossus kowalevskii]